MYSPVGRYINSNRKTRRKQNRRPMVACLLLLFRFRRAGSRSPTGSSGQVIFVQRRKIDKPAIPKLYGSDFSAVDQFPNVVMLYIQNDCRFCCRDILCQFVAHFALFRRFNRARRRLSPLCVYRFLLGRAFSLFSWHELDTMQPRASKCHLHEVTWCPATQSPSPDVVLQKWG